MPRARGGRNGRGRRVSAQTAVAVNSEHNETNLTDEAIPEERYFLNPNAVSPHLMCSICQEVFNEPYRAPCGHSYCKSCIFMWLKNNKSCPEDRRALDTNSLHKDFIVENIINDYKVACPWRTLGCLFVGPLHSLANHKNSCQFNPKAMPKILREYSKEIIEKTSHDMFSKSVQENLNALRSTASTGSATMNTTSFDSSSSITGSALLDRLLAESEETDSEIVEPENSAPLMNAANSNSAPSTSSNSSSVDNVMSLPNTLNPIVDTTESDEENIPDAPLPSLRMRLYVGGNEESRNLLCNFLEGPRNIDLPTSSSQAPAAKRPKTTFRL